MNTSLQESVFEFLKTASVAPSFKEIAQHLGPTFDPTTARPIVCRLEKKGLVSMQPKKPRSIKVLMPQMSAAAA
jgi:hypothetical protein